MARSSAKAGWLWAALAILFALASQEARARENVPDRPTMALADGWRFKLENVPTGPQQPDFDDSAWAQVSVPHTWNRVGYYMSDPETHLNKAADINKTMGIGWYRLGFRPAASFNGKRAWLQFDAASRIAEVWLNGVYLGQHRGGFSRFRLDATAALKPGQLNLLAVKVDNSKPEPGSTTSDVLPLTGDFFVHGGLYRPVNLIATDAIHIDMLDHGGPGIFAQTLSITGQSAIVRVQAKLRNDGNVLAPVQVVAKLVDHRGRVAAQDSQQVTLGVQSGGQFDAALQIPRARLWNGTADPYLYTLVVEMRGDRGQLLDRRSLPFGVRQMRMDASSGFTLNGKPYPLRGVGYHQDREGKGWAISAEDVQGDLEMLREMGANSIRLTHYQHGQPVHNLADRYGFVLWDEIPLVSQWTMGDARSASPALVANARQQLAELIAQNGNHASVATWGIANEVDFGNSMPGFLTGSSKNPPDPLPLLRELSQLARQLDPSRPTALATCCEGRLFAPGIEVPTTAPEADLGGANRYFGWYYGKPDELGASLDALHAKRPGQPLSVTEYGAGGAINIHTDNPWAAPADSRGRKQPEEVESMVHEGNWRDLRRRSYLWGTWLWVAFDFASTVRHEGDAQDINTKGLVTYDRKARKDAFHFYKANWTTTPTVYITGRRYVDRAYPVTDVRVYSNAPVTTLTVNGRKIGEQATCENGVCVWQAVRLSAGRNVIAAQGRFAGGKRARDQVVWNLDSASADGLRIDAGALVAAKSDGGRFGSDNFFTGGAAGSVDRPANYGRPQVPTPIAGTADRDIAATFRQGRFAYRLPLVNGRYTVRLTFVEPAVQAGERVFEVAANGTTVLPALDIAGMAGGSAIAVQRSFDVVVTDGHLDLAFVPVKGDAIVSAIEVLSSFSGT